MTALTSNHPRALVVDDETQMLSIVAFALETQGIDALTARTAEMAWTILQREHLDLAILDVTLPGASGIDLCQRIRHESDLPVILLTARTAEDHRIAGLLAGADDYVTKPFSPRELALRAQAVLRRTRPRPTSELVCNGPLVIDPLSRQARIGTRILHLSDVEFRLLTALARRPGEVVSWHELLNEVWHTGEHVGCRDMIKSTVYRLRNHLRENRDWVTAVRGTGYLMPVLPDAEDEA